MLISRTGMKPIVVYSGITVALLLSGLVAWAFDYGGVSETLPPDAASVESVNSSPSPVAVNPPTLDKDIAHVEVLKRDLNAVTSKVGQLEAQLALLSRGNGTASEPRDINPKAATSEIPVGQASADQTTPLERIRHFQAVMQTEQEDPRVTATLQTAFKAAMENAEIPPGSSVTGISCRETMCKVSASHNGQGALDQFLRSFPATVPWDMTAEIEYEAFENGTSQTVVFVSMKDKSLPEK